MFGIQLNNTFLDLYSKTALSFELNNPAYLGDDIDVIPNAFMFTIKVPLTGLNRRQLNYPDRVDNADFFLSSEECGVWCEGIEVFRSLLSVRSATPTDAEISLTVNTISQLKDLLLTQLNHDTVDLSAIVDPVSYLSGSCISPDIRDFICFPVWNPDFYETADQTEEFYEKTYQNMWDTDVSSVSKLKIDSKSPVTPFLKVSYILRKMAESTGFTLNNAWQTNRELSQLCTYNNFSIVKWNTAGTTYTLDATLDLKNHVSKAKCSDYLKSLRTLFNLGIYVNFFDKTLSIVPNSQVLQASARHDWTQKVISETTKTKTLNYPTRFSYATNPSVLPDISKLSRYPSAPALSTDPEGIYTNAIGGRLYHRPEAVQSEYIAVELDNYVKFGNVDKYALESPLSTMPSARVFMNGFGVTTAPGIRTKGAFRIDSAEVSEATFEDRLIFYRGMSDFKTSGGGDNAAYANFCPLASSEDNTAVGYRIKTGWDTDIIAGGSIPTAYAPADVEYTLLWNGTKGLYNRWWATWHQMLQVKRDVKVNLALTTKEIRAFSFQDKVRIGNKEYLVKKLRVSLTAEGLAATEADLVTVI